MKHRSSLAALALAKVNGVYAAAAGSAGGCVISILPIVTEWLKFGSALMSIASGILAFYLHFRKRKEKAKQ